MGKKRKRPIKKGQSREYLPQVSTQTSSRVGVPCVLSKDAASEYSHPVISIYYRQVVTLRQYLLKQIPLSSKSRRRRIASVPTYDPTNSGLGGLSQLLDTTLVGVLKEPTPARSQELRRELADFTASQDRSLLISTDTGPPCPQAESWR
ncbi:uncharacterized protein BDW43DRAFT_121394 [Aspergillus alliaceus]|uniref:uncharacterized protein n=1 Tax=Petromyces alliaceus TaxID=209559 RepID=UPI0012A3BF8D|nr:uncharacterized protein BDW43DRAFT_121394 [Aspergillus alliaceus]KAB8238673.1 hypothetical protein BDW43DRAFT_121394 [Aspergillus alliaceus]